ncbi:hypothetical protein SOVF_097230 [Spinacia oleracea]|nr:hypothetical protein SOVF_097230 [Spinacia oleracea]
MFFMHGKGIIQCSFHQQITDQQFYDTKWCRKKTFQQLHVSLTDC